MNGAKQSPEYKKGRKGLVPLIDSSSQEHFITCRSQ
jgi:hypothetical protein